MSCIEKKTSDKSRLARLSIETVYCVSVELSKASG